ncbi:hypothetical protein PSACC_02326 [Paramicrosporidium saccamoebae]|uniref:Activator of Hsp90 ATPase AHSA1-like N-terminal domain-containing protein n=1 Tax=Paramicrosporidium saccamoebae TaxID=1246581 RepID=A0A2H9TJE0_9FUNG|nr:hypothetical protein PSACC_02326 [Paramicrosporidium saccamoebae]
MLPTAKTILDGQALKVTKVNSVTGEVSVNVRKGRIRQIFDLTMELTCMYEKRDVEARITDFMSDMDYDDFEFTMTGVAAKVRDALKKTVWETLVEFRKEVEQVHGKSLLVEGPQTPASADSEKSKFNNSFVDKKEKSPSAVGTIEERVEFSAPMEQVWLCLTDVPRIMAWTRGTASLSSVEPGAPFSLLGGNITGRVTELATGLIKMDWRLRHWPSELVSTVEIKLSNGGSGTVLKMKQVGVPSAELDSVKENWHRYYWEPIKTVLGCASAVF